MLWYVIVINFDVWLLIVCCLCCLFVTCFLFACLFNSFASVFCVIDVVGCGCIGYCVLLFVCFEWFPVSLLLFCCLIVFGYYCLIAMVFGVCVMSLVLLDDLLRVGFVVCLFWLFVGYLLFVCDLLASAVCVWSLLCCFVLSCVFVCNNVGVLLTLICGLVLWFVVVCASCFVYAWCLICVGLDVCVLLVGCCFLFVVYFCFLDLVVWIIVLRGFCD